MLLLRWNHEMQEEKRKFMYKGVRKNILQHVTFGDSVPKA
jgi:hypothetical protein